jgi:hypothetical protein
MGGWSGVRRSLADTRISYVCKWCLSRIKNLFSAKVFSYPMLGWSLSPQHGASTGCGWRNGLQLLGVATNVLNDQPRTNCNWWSTSFQVGRGAKDPSP